MTSQVVRVRRETLAACMTCPLCNKLLRDATTISECLHTFCRKCIYDKLTDEEEYCCPMCNIDLGCTPVEKLRPDHNLQDVRAKIFPFKRRKLNASEAVLSVPLPVRIKERSLSSLGVNTPRVSTQTGLTGRRTKAVARKAAALRSNFTIEEHVKKEEDLMDDCPESSSSPETLNKFAQNRRQNSSTTKLPNHHMPIKDRENGAESWAGKVDLWKPLNTLVEAANRTKSFKSGSHGAIVKSEPINGSSSEEHAPKSKMKEHGHKLKGQEDRNGSTSSPTGSAKPRKLHGMRRKRASTSREQAISAQAVLDAAGARSVGRISPIWFSLVASEDQEGDAPLPQISSCYLRIKDGNVPVSLIQKYLVKKLNLMSEAEVEILCHGQPVVPTLQLHNLIDLWLRTASTSQRVAATVSTSAKDFVMVLAYARKAQAP